MHVSSWERNTQKIYAPSKIQGTISQYLKKLIVEQSDEIYGVNTINWEDSSRKHFSLIGDEEVINLSHAKVCVFSDSVLCLGKINQSPQSNMA